MVELQSVRQGRTALLAWYDEHKRELPWRNTRDPWAIWISEVMLQQTRVVSVLEYYPRFLERFPTPQALADASWEEVSALWAGLGYYRRARHLQQAAQQLCERFGGHIPANPQQFGTLQGVGRYTQGAVMSIAFDLEEPIVDGNVIRVFTRWYAEEQNARSPEVVRKLWRWASEWVIGTRAGDLNQSIMELGATICTPKNPRCDRCPLAFTCQAYQQHCVERLPYLPKQLKTLPIEIYLAALVRDKQGKVWVVQTSQEGLLGGLWGFPMLRWSEDSKIFDDLLAGQSNQLSLFETIHPQSEECLNQVRSLFKQQRNLEVNQLITSIKHRFTHKEWRVYLFDAIGIPQQREGESELRCVGESELSQMGVGGPSLKAGRKAGLALKARRGAGEH